MQARTRGGGGGGALLKSSIHMSIYCVYVGHTHLIENSTHFCKKEPPVSKAGYRPGMLSSDFCSIYLCHFWPWPEVEDLAPE